MSKRRRDGLLQDAGLTGSSLVSGLALKADMHLTWFSLRKLRVCLREFGICLQSERCMRAEMEAELPFHFISEKVSMCDKSGHVILCAMVAVPDLMGLVLHYIDEYDRTDQLVWHDGAIPDDTIVVKIGGEQGGEALHAAFNELTRRHCGIPCPVKQLLTTTRQHYITTIPNLADKTPAKKRRTSQ